MCNL